MQAYKAYWQYHLIPCHLARIKLGSNVDDPADLAIRRTKVVAVGRAALWGLFNALVVV
jgi:hypothetical protein